MNHFNLTYINISGPGKSFSIGGNFTHGMQKESRTITLQNGNYKYSIFYQQLKEFH